MFTTSLSARRARTEAGIAGESNLVKRDFETGIVLLVACVLLVAAAVTWRDIESDRELTIAESARLTEALVASVEDHLEAALRDASNAALSAAMLVENAGGIAALKGEKQTHAELKRELWDESSTARLVLTGPGGLVVASSANYPVKPGTRVETRRQWPVAQPGGRAFKIGEPVRSPIGGDWVIPYWCDVLDAQGAPAGTLRAELRVAHFVEALDRVAGIHHGAVVVTTHDAVAMMRVPFEEKFLGSTPKVLSDAVKAATGNHGTLSVTSPFDGVTRTYSWRRMERLPLLVGIGLDRSTVLAGWETRTWRRAGVLAAASVALLAMAFALILHLRRLARSQQALRDAQVRYWVAMQSSSIGIAVASLEGRWLDVNPALCRLLGFRREELLGRDPEELTAPEFRTRRAWVLASLASGEMDHFTAEKRLVDKAGREVWAHVHTVATTGADGQPDGLIVHFQDITERRNAEQAVRALNLALEQRVAERTAELSRANSDLEAFSYSAAHDLRDPLARLSMFVDVLARDLGDARTGVARRLDAIRGQIGAMTGLIENLLALARSSRAALRPQPVPMGALVREAIDILAPACEGRAVEWRVGPLPTVSADRELLREALGNLLGNALKYTRGRDPAVIEVGMEPPGEGDEAGEAVVFIRDNGAGFDMAHAGELFAPFKRLHTAAQFEGTGIGLAIVERIVERNGGRIWAEAEPGRGATFRFALPAVHAAAPAQGQAQAA